MGFQCGIVGLPNVGKSTLFNALTKAGIAAQNFPFCTIEPNVGTVAVPDPRLNQLADMVKPQKVVPTHMQFVDIAGLVAGAAKGEGLGNQFLAHIRETDAIAHVVRCFSDNDIVHVAGKIDPISDVETISTELLLADLETVERALQKAEKNSKSGNKEKLAEKKLLEQVKQHLDAGQPVRSLSLDTESNIIKQLITNKPTLYVANVAEDGFTNNPYLEKLIQHANAEGTQVVAICASIEAEIAELNDEDKQDFLTEMGLNEAGLNRVIRAGYQLLELQTYFTAGVKEVRAWTIKQGDSAPIAAGKIHTDFMRGFICAAVTSFDDFMTYQGEAGAKEAGKLRIEGKDYIVKDGDVIEFRFNV